MLRPPLHQPRLRSAWLQHSLVDHTERYCRDISRQEDSSGCLHIALAWMMEMPYSEPLALQLAHPCSAGAFRLVQV